MKPVENFKLPITNYYYHITYKDLGNTVILEPKIPSVFADAEDYSTPRICVSDSVLGCTIGIANGNNYTVYGVLKKDIKFKIITNEEIVKDKLVWDAHISREAWLLESISVKKFGTITISEDDRIAIEFTPLTVSKGMYKWNNYNQSRNVIYTEICGYKWIEGKDPSDSNQKVFDIVKYAKNL